MSAKFSASRRRAFLTYLAQTGNQTLSAERAKVSRSWVCLHRSGDAEFDAACRAKIAEAKGRLRLPTPGPSLTGRGGASNAPPSAWKYLDGAELVVRGTNGRRTQIARARLKQWSPRVEERFLRALAATCNVKAACAEVAMRPGSAYAHRRRWPAFAQAWDEAVELGYVRIEAALVEAAGNLFSKPDFAPETPIAGMTAADAIHLLHMHKHAVRGIGKRPGLPERAATSGEVVEALRKRLVSFDAWMRHEGKEAKHGDTK